MSSGVVLDVGLESFACFPMHTITHSSADWQEPKPGVVAKDLLHILKSVYQQRLHVIDLRHT